jgi:DNA-binding transcriptional LysR family regulator
MDTYRLQQFCLVVDTGSLTIAAELLGISHSGLSRSMKALQTELATELFQARGRGLAVTEEGIKAYGQAKAILAGVDALRTRAKTSPSVLRIGTVEVFLHGLARGLRRRAFHEGPLVLLDVEPGEMERQLIAGQLDFGITYAPSPESALDVLEIGRFRLGCFHLRGPLEQVGLKELPFAVPVSALPHNPLGIKERDGWLQGLFSRRETFQVNLLSVAIDLALEGLCAIYIPVFVARGINQSLGEKKLVERPLPSPPQTRRAFALKRLNRPEDAPFKRMCGLVRGLCSTQDGPRLSPRTLRL